MAEELAGQNMVVVAVQASKMDPESLNSWRNKYGVSIPIGIVQTDQEKARFAWGVRSLPWLILSDSRRIVTAEGFRLSELGSRIEATK